MATRQVLASQVGNTELYYTALNCTVSVLGKTANIRSNIALGLRELPKAKDYIWLCIPPHILIHTIYKNYKCIIFISVFSSKAGYTEIVILTIYLSGRDYILHSQLLNIIILKFNSTVLLHQLGNIFPYCPALKALQRINSLNIDILEGQCWSCNWECLYFDSSREIWWNIAIIWH